MNANQVVIPMHVMDRTSNETIYQLAEKLWDSSIEMVKKNKGLSPELASFLISSDKVVIVPHDTDNPKELYFHAINYLLKEIQPIAVIFVSDSWVVKRSLDDKDLESVRPSTDPNKKSAITQVVMMPDGSTNGRIYMYEIKDESISDINDPDIPTGWQNGFSFTTQLEAWLTSETDEVVNHTLQ